MFKVLASPQITNSDEVVRVYHQCLQWYESFFAMLKADGSNSPFVLFIQYEPIMMFCVSPGLASLPAYSWIGYSAGVIVFGLAIQSFVLMVTCSMYYQFCLLSLFRPHISATLRGLHSHPWEICLQAAQSILVLCQSHAGVFDLHRVCLLVPYFVGAAAMISLAVREARDGITKALPIAQPDYQRDEAVIRTTEPPGEATAKESEPKRMYVDKRYGEDFVEGRHGTCHPAPIHLNMPMVTHARLLLSEMSAIHPAAALFDDMLQRMSTRN